MSSTDLDVVNQVEAAYKTEGEKAANEKLCGFILFSSMSDQTVMDIILEVRKRIGKESL